MLSRRQSNDISWAHSLAGTAADGCDQPQLAHCRLLLRGVMDARSWAWQQVP